MSGRAYTMKEMREIVEYIKERKVFSEIRARKMWMDYASSDLTTRTWQSLKETFLKRILPDIHNPYYNLTPYELRSFREGREIRPSQNKLEFRSSSPKPNTVVQIDSEEPSTSHGNQNGHKSGEDVKCSKLDTSRESVDTVILADDDLEELEKEKDEAVPQRAKSLRDCITYTEPLTPMMQEIMHDFSSDDEPQLTIDEGQGNMEEVEDIEQVLLDNIVAEKPPEQDTFDSHPLNKEATETIKPSKRKTLSLKSPQKDKNKDDSSAISDNQTTENYTRVTRSKKTDANIEEADENSNKVTPSKTQTPIPNSITDSLLPNNQEGLQSIEDTNKESSIEPLETSQDKPALKSAKGKKNKVDNSEAPVEKSNEDPKAISIKSPKPKWKIRGDKLSKIDSKISDKNVTKESPKKTKLANKKGKAVVAENTETVTENKDAEIPGNEQNVNEKTIENTQVEMEINDDDIIEKVVENKEQDKPNDEIEVVENVLSQPSSNPCLQSVSLYEEQFKSLVISDIEDEETNSQSIVDINKSLINNQVTITKTKASNKELVKSSKSNNKPKSSPAVLSNQSKLKVPAVKEVLFVQSDSDSERFDTLEVVKPKTVSTNPITKQRNKILNNLFDGGPKKHKMHGQGHRNGHVNLDSESSEWTSESDDEYVYPPRARNRHSRKYLKPSSGRILALEQAGALLVASGRRVYPLVRDGRLLQHYLTYEPESDTEQKEESYWQKKYIEEKKRTAELTKLLERSVKEDGNKRRSTLQPNSPILPSKPVKIDKSIPVHDITSSNENLHCSEIVLPKQVEEPKEEKSVKIKFAKDNEEVFLEGPWQSLHHILGDVMQAFHRGGERSEQKDRAGDAPVLIEEADEEVHKKVDQLEEAIFKEIEEKDKSAEEEISLPKVTERKRKARQLSIKQDSSQHSLTPSKRQKTEENDRSDSEIIVNETKLRPVEGPSETRRKANKKTVIENISEEPIAKSSPRKSKTATKTEEDDENITLYKFPSPEPERKTRLSRGSKKIAELPPNKPSIQVTLPSPESTQGYQDSDGSPKYNLRKKRKSLTYVVQGKNKFSRNMRKKVYDFDASDESSNPLPNLPNVTIRKVKKSTLPDFEAMQSVTEKTVPNMVTIQNVSVNTEVYRSESYQLLMPKVILEPVAETSPCPNDVDSVCGNNSLNLSPVSQSLYKADKSEYSISIDLQVERDSSNISLPNEGNSSNVSLPPSPELSIVENITVSKNVLNTVDYPTINETQANGAAEGNQDKYLLSPIDVSIPLMEQDCNVKMSLKKDEGTFQMDVSEGKTVAVDPVVDSLMDKFGIADENPTISESLDDKMRELLLESAKKVKGAKKKVAKKPKKLPINKEPKKAQKRCSTPRKKKDTQTKALSIDAVIEEQMEFCSNVRRSCPPVIVTINETDTPIGTQTEPLQKKAKKQKEIIKVKILRPKRDKTETVKKRGSQSVADSGINDTTVSGFLDFNNTVDLIHNHSETCLANECYDDSVVFLENSKSKSIISLNSTVVKEDASFDIDISEGLPPEVYSCDARDGASEFTGQKANLAPSSGDMDYHTPPASISSLSSQPGEELRRRPDWGLLSEDELTTSDLPTHTNCTNQETNLKLSSPHNTDLNSERSDLTFFSASGHFFSEIDLNTEGTDLSHLFPSGGSHLSSGSSLRQLFPVACSVPNLSTITELSRETDANTKDASLINDRVIESLLDDFITCSNNC